MLRHCFAILTAFALVLGTLGTANFTLADDTRYSSWNDGGDATDALIERLNELINEAE